MQFFSISPKFDVPISYAQTVGSCFSNGPVFLSNSTVWQNLQCVHIGTISINGTGSLTMINSSLVQEVVNATPSDLNLSGYAQLNLESSTVNLGGIGSLLLGGNASTTMVTSGLVNSSVVLSNAGQLSANESSFLNLDGFNSTSIAPLNFTDSTLDVASQSFGFYVGTTFVPVAESGVVDVLGNGSLEFDGGTFQASNTSLVQLNTLNDLILNSHLTNYNITQFLIGNSSLTYSETTIEDSQISSTFTTNVTIGSLAANSTTEVFSSSILVSNGYSQNVSLYGTSALTVDNSTIGSQVGSTIESFGTMILYGGAVSIFGSNVYQSTFDYYGYAATAASNLIVNSTLYFNIISSKLMSGQVSQSGVYVDSHLVLNSGANMTIEGSLLGSNALSNNTILIRSSYPPTIVHNMTLSQDTIQSGPNPSNITLSSGYGLLLNTTTINVIPNSTISVNTYQLTAYNSAIPGNITVGSSLAFAYLYNTSVNNVIGLKTGTYQKYEWYFIHVVINGSSQTSVPGATVTLTDPNDSSILYTGVTNSSGWAKISVVQAESNSTTSINQTDYVAQAQKSGVVSNEAFAATNSTTYVNLYMNPSNDPNPSLNYFSYPVEYAAGLPVSYMGIYTNSYPLNFFNNGTYSEIDFNTYGPTGTTYSFVLAYPENFTTAPLSVSVNQVPLKDVKFTSNKTYYFATFSIPSGYNSVVLSYVAPNTNYLGVTNPILSPSASVIAVVILLLIVGTVFIFYYVKRQNSLAKAT